MWSVNIDLLFIQAHLSYILQCVVQHTLTDQQPLRYRLHRHRVPVPAVQRGRQAAPCILPQLPPLPAAVDETQCAAADVSSCVYSAVMYYVLCVVKWFLRHNTVPMTL